MGLTFEMIFILVAVALKWRKKSRTTNMLELAHGGNEK